MPTYSGIVTKQGVYYPDNTKRQKWLDRNAGEWVKTKYTLLSSKIKDPKSRGQLGWYWVLLLPQITAELVRLGHTIEVEVMRGIVRKSPYTEEIVHEGLTIACGLVGEDGKGLRVSEMDKFQASTFLTHVLDVARELKMDVKELEAVKKGELK